MLAFISKGKAYTRGLRLGKNQASRFSVSIASYLVGASFRGIDTIAGYYGFRFKGRSTCESQRDGMKPSRDYTGLVWTGTASGCNGLDLATPDVRPVLFWTGHGKHDRWYNRGSITCDYRDLAPDHGVDTVVFVK